MTDPKKNDHISQLSLWSWLSGPASSSCFFKPHRSGIMETDNRKKTSKRKGEQRGEGVTVCFGSFVFLNFFTDFQLIQIE